MATIGQSIVFKGELTGDEDLEIEGQVDGNVNLTNHQLTIGANGRLKAEVMAKSIIVIGQVKGNLTATERIEIQATGVVEGDVRAPRLNVQEGAVLNGNIDMSAGPAVETRKPSSAAASPPAAAPAGQSAPAEALKSA
ncbi:MAG: polymer-forming cytoskeletal protein [Spirochaetaceae bacterium]|nr:polymer-forming cytoskeletal protein [Myxococcales bacterium]MCB9726164.1 polymer-forming cytoskeletal protein [Spirochaetaceae bacterium]